MATFRVSVFKRGKQGPELVPITEVLADEFVPAVDGSVTFWVVEKRFLRKPVPSLVASLPVGEWVVQ